MIYASMVLMKDSRQGTEADLSTKESKMQGRIVLNMWRLSVFVYVGIFQIIYLLQYSDLTPVFPLHMNDQIKGLSVLPDF
jgi:hypothetical protein